MKIACTYAGRWIQAPWESDFLSKTVLITSGEPEILTLCEGKWGDVVGISDRPSGLFQKPSRSGWRADDLCDWGVIPSSCRRQTQEAGKAQTQKEEACSAYFLCRKGCGCKIADRGISSGCRYQEGIEKVPAGTRCLMFKEVYGLV